jgi:hypothetical protein
MATAILASTAAPINAVDRDIAQIVSCGWCVPNQSIIGVAGADVLLEESSADTRDCGVV